MDELEVPLSRESDIQQLIFGGGLLAQSGLSRDSLSVGLIVARNQMLRGDAAAALRTYSVLVVFDAANVDFQLGLANCAWEVGEHGLSVQAASAAVALAPGNPRGYFFSGRACLALGHLMEARQDLEEAVTLGRKARDATIVQEANALLRRLEIQ